MRVLNPNSDIQVKAIAGTHVVLMALNIDTEKRKGLRGFAIKRGEAGKPAEWLRGIKYFDKLEPDHKAGDDYSSRDQPFQSFLWSDYRAWPDTQYKFEVVALYGDLHAFEEKYHTTFDIKTEPENDGKHGIWFNRGAIASHAREAHFQNAYVTDEMVNNVSDDGKLLDPQTKWLSRGLAEACLAYINGTKAGEGLRVCAYEFTYAPILNALKRAHDRGVDLEIVYHLTRSEKDANLKAIKAAKLPTKILHKRTRTAIPHNKFIVKLKGNKPVAVWTGSTNFTDSGFYGQTNVGHLVTDNDLAEIYLKLWEELKDDPVHSVALENAIEISPNPKNVIAADSVSPFFSPRIADNMLDWYGQRIDDCGSLSMMTIPFNVAPTILKALAKKREAMRLVILEDPLTKDVNDAEKANRGKLAFSNGAILGKSFIKYKSQFGGAKVAPIPNSDLDKWFADEELARPTNNGHVFFVHAKVLIVDPLSEDPLVCSGSANFSKNSLTANDENMLLIRGEQRVADIYVTELDRIFRHFRARDMINHDAADGEEKNYLLLDETDDWITENFRVGSYKDNRRLLFFPDGSAQLPSWSHAAAADGDPFSDEADRAKAEKKAKSDKAKARRQAAAKTSAKKNVRKGKKRAAKAAPKKKAAKAKKRTAKKAVKKKKTAR